MMTSNPGNCSFRLIYREGELHLKSRPNRLWIEFLAVAILISIVALICAQPGYRILEIYSRQSPQVTQPVQDVVRWISDLSKDSPETRETARGRLLAMGPEIEPQLQWALNTARGSIPGVDFRRAGIRYDIVELTVLIDHLEQLRHSKPTTVTIHATDTSDFDILRSFGLQIDLPVSASSRPDPGQANMDWLYSARTTLNLDRVNYWEALKAIRRRLDLVPTFSGGGVTFNRAAGLKYPDFPPDATNAIVAGPLLIAPTSVERIQPGLTLTLRAVAEPKVGAGRYGEYATVQLDEVLDDRGSSLLRQGARPSFGSVTIDPTQRTLKDGLWTFKVPVLLPSPAAERRIRSIKGRFGVAIGPPGMDIAIADLTRDGVPAFEWDGVMVTVTSVRRLGNQFQITGEFSAPADSPLSKAMAEKDTSGQAMANARIRLAERLGLLDAAGTFVRREVSLGAVRHDADRDKMSWTLTTMDNSRLPAAADSCNSACVPVTLTWSADIETRWWMTAFELKNIPEPVTGASGSTNR
jgi:hypothetical protein